MVNHGIIVAIVQCNPLFGDEAGAVMITVSCDEEILDPVGIVYGVTDLTYVDEWLAKAFGDE